MITSPTSPAEPAADACPSPPPEAPQRWGGEPRKGEESMGSSSMGDGANAETSDEEDDALPQMMSVARTNTNGDIVVGQTESTISVLQATDHNNFDNCGEEQHEAPASEIKSPTVLPPGETEASREARSSDVFATTSADDSPASRGSMKTPASGERRGPTWGVAAVLGGGMMPITSPGSSGANTVAVPAAGESLKMRPSNNDVPVGQNRGRKGEKELLEAIGDINTYIAEHWVAFDSYRQPTMKFQPSPLPHAAETADQAGVIGQPEPGKVAERRAIKDRRKRRLRSRGATPSEAPDPDDETEVASGAPDDVTAVSGPSTGGVAEQPPSCPPSCADTSNIRISTNAVPAPAKPTIHVADRVSQAILVDGIGSQNNDGQVDFSFKPAQRAITIASNIRELGGQKGSASSPFSFSRFSAKKQQEDRKRSTSVVHEQPLVGGLRSEKSEPSTLFITSSPSHGWTEVGAEEKGDERGIVPFLKNGLGVGEKRSPSSSESDEQWCLESRREVTEKSWSSTPTRTTESPPETNTCSDVDWQECLDGCVGGASSETLRELFNVPQEMIDGALESPEPQVWLCMRSDMVKEGPHSLDERRKRMPGYACDSCMPAGRMFDDFEEDNAGGGGTPRRFRSAGGDGDDAGGDKALSTRLFGFLTRKLGGGDSSVEKSRIPHGRDSAANLAPAGTDRDKSPSQRSGKLSTLLRGVRGTEFTPIVPLGGEAAGDCGGEPRRGHGGVADFAESPSRRRSVSEGEDGRTENRPTANWAAGGGSSTESRAGQAEQAPGVSSPLVGGAGKKGKKSVSEATSKELAGRSPYRFFRSARNESESSRSESNVQSRGRSHSAVLGAFTAVGDDAPRRRASMGALGVGSKPRHRRAFFPKGVILGNGSWEKVCGLSFDEVVNCDDLGAMLQGALTSQRSQETFRRAFAGMNYNSEREKTSPSPPMLFAVLNYRGNYEGPHQQRLPRAGVEQRPVSVRKFVRGFLGRVLQNEGLAKASAFESVAPEQAIGDNKNESRCFLNIIQAEILRDPNDPTRTFPILKTTLKSCVGNAAFHRLVRRLASTRRKNRIPQADRTEAEDIRLRFARLNQGVNQHIVLPACKQGAVAAATVEGVLDSGAGVTDPGAPQRVEKKRASAVSFIDHYLGTEEEPTPAVLNLEKHITVDIPSPSSGDNASSDGSGKTGKTGKRSRTIAHTSPPPGPRGGSPAADGGTRNVQLQFHTSSADVVGNENMQLVFLTSDKVATQGPDALGVQRREFYVLKTGEQALGNDS